MGSPSLLLLALAASGDPVPSATALKDADIVEHECRVMVEDAAGKPVITAVTGLHVLAGAAAEGPFKPELPNGTRSILCYRNTIVPAEHDDEVIALGLPLILSEPGAKGRTGFLEMEDGRFQYQFENGDLTKIEQAYLQERINRFQVRSQREPVAATAADPPG